MEGQVRIIDSLSGIGSIEFDGWLAHALCVWKATLRYALTTGIFNSRRAT